MVRTFGSDSCASVRASCQKRAYTVALGEGEAISLIATLRPSLVSTAAKTRPIPPRANSSTSRYRASRTCPAFGPPGAAPSAEPSDGFMEPRMREVSMADEDGTSGSSDHGPAIPGGLRETNSICSKPPTQVHQKRLHAYGSRFASQLMKPLRSFRIAICHGLTPASLFSSHWIM